MPDPQPSPGEVKSRASRRRVWPLILIAIVLAIAATAAPSLYRTAVLGSGFLAQRLCGEVFVAKRDPKAVLAEDLSGPGYELLPFFQPIVDRDKQRVTASAFGIGRQTSIFREGLGCTRLAGKTEGELRDEAAGLFRPVLPPDPSDLWPEGERVDLRALPASVDRTALEQAIAAAFTEPDPIPTVRARWSWCIKVVSWRSAMRLHSTPQRPSLAGR
jgi:hypothetical protein